jgi:hypothetical protein
LLQGLRESRQAGVPFRLVRGIRCEHADAPHPLGLLRARAIGHAAVTAKRLMKSRRVSGPRGMCFPHAADRHRHYRTPSGFTFAYYICSVVKPAGASDCPASSANCNYAPVVQDSIRLL